MITFLKANYTNKLFKGDIDVSNEKIDSLRGSPKETTGGFYCDYNNLKTLKYAPEKVGGMFDCSHNAITSLKYAPTEIDGTLFCLETKIASFEDFIKEVIENRIKAKFYRFNDLTKIPFADIEKEFNDFEMINKVQSKGFRTLLGINK